MILDERPAQDADFAALYQLHVDSMKDYVAATYGWDDVQQEGFFRERWQGDLPRLRVIEDGGTIIAAYRVEPDPDTLYLGQIEVARSHQGRGIGTRLVSTLLAEARAAGKVVTLSVMKANPRARALYERLGFVVIAETPTHFHMRAG